MSALVVLLVVVPAKNFAVQLLCRGFAEFEGAMWEGDIAMSVEERTEESS
jgi:hypothetical protein